MPDTAKGRIFVIRHAQCLGQEPGAVLTPDGTRKAVQLAESLADSGIERIFSSPYRRAMDTATPIAERLGVPVIQDQRLVERLLSPVPIADWRERLRASFDDFDLALPGGESSREAMWRAEAAWADVVQVGGCSAIVTHGNLTALMLRSLDPRWGFEQWAALAAPDVYRADRSNLGWTVTRVPLG